jgi:hypothetical protein
MLCMPVFLAVREEYPCVGQQTYPLHFTVEWAEAKAACTTPRAASTPPSNATTPDGERPSSNLRECDSKTEHAARQRTIFGFSGTHGFVVFRLRKASARRHRRKTTSRC